VFEPESFKTFEVDVTALAEKLPEASRLTIVEAVFAFVAAFARFAPDATFAAVTEPTVATVGFGYVPERSPPADPFGGNADGIDDQLKLPDVSDERT
jgi:hypothetical protein